MIDPQEKSPGFHKHATIAEKFGRDWGAIEEFLMQFITEPH
jgi:hypothetical protein